MFSTSIRPQPVANRVPCSGQVVSQVLVFPIVFG